MADPAPYIHTDWGRHLLAQKKATRAAEMMSVERVAIFWVVNASRNEISCLQFLIPTAVFHMLLKRIPTIRFFKHVIIWQVAFCE